MPSQTESLDTIALTLIAFLAVYLYLRVTVGWILNIISSDIDHRTSDGRDRPPAADPSALPQSLDTSSSINDRPIPGHTSSKDSETSTPNSDSC